MPCSDSNRNRGVRVAVTCAFCGAVELVQVYKSKRVYCNRACRDAHLRITMKGAGNRAWKPPETLTCRECGRAREMPGYEVRARAGFCSPEYRGSNSPQWRGGTSSLGERFRASTAYREWRAAVFTRDDYRCQRCGVRGGGYLHAHHVKPLATHPELGLEVANGRTLCVACHDATHAEEGLARGDGRLADYLESIGWEPGEARSTSRWRKVRAARAALAPKPCAKCGVEFMPDRITGRFCSRKCKKRFHG
jgi:hypothetical protein